MYEIHKTWNSDGFGSRICRALSGFVSVPSLQTKSDELKTENRGCGKTFWTLLPHNSDLLNLKSSIGGPLKYFVYRIDKPDSEALRAKTRPAHLEYAEKIRDKLVFAGPTLSEDGSKMTASVWIIEADSFDEAEAITRQDPFEKVDLFESKEIHRFMQVIPEE